jgi:phage tail-like protein
MSFDGRTDPYLDYRFLVEVGSLIAGGFSEVTGLEASMEAEEYEEGGVNAYTHKLPTRMKHQNIVLKRGLTRDSGLWSWIEEATNDPPKPDATSRRNVRIFLQETTGREAIGWECRRALPVRWAGPELDASGGAVAIETLELAHHGLSRIEGLL